MASKIKQPFPLQGSKRKLAPVAESLFPEGVTELFEPFCGSAAVSLHLVASDFSGPVHINDKTRILPIFGEQLSRNPRG
ncbi:DNA adenine methylase [Cutibacterium sp. V970]|uniref:DNA adenine methylase n=1 Tax=Cutibacterium sp. V970 TaxID=3446481 RepID=UPI003EE21BF8